MEGVLKWDPAKYVEFGNHRDRPYFDLTARVHTDRPRHVVDLGCGPGNLTATLAERWPGAEILGIDSSAEMLQKAAEHSARASNLSFAQADVAEWMPSNRTDVVVSNAALQWVPGHPALLAGWLEALRPGAWFALQVPGNFRSPSHVLMRQLAGSGRWKKAVGGVLQHDDAVAEPAQYLNIMLDAGCDADAWETTYQQVLQGQDPVLEWVRGAGLRPVLAALPAAEAAEFEAEYSALLRGAYPATSHGTVFPFRRIFAVARKRG